MPTGSDNPPGPRFIRWTRWSWEGPKEILINWHRDHKTYEWVGIDHYVQLIQRQRQEEQHMAESKALSIQEEALKQIKDMAPALESAIVEELSAIELKRRMVPLVLGLDNLHKLDLEIKKADKPDLKFRTTEGDDVAAYSDKKLEELKKLREKKDKLIKAWEKAFYEGELNDLNQLNQSFGKPDKQDKTENKSESSGESST